MLFVQTATPPNIPHASSGGKPTPCRDKISKSVNEGWPVWSDSVIHPTLTHTHTLCVIPGSPKISRNPREQERVEDQRVVFCDGLYLCMDRALDCAWGQWDSKNQDSNAHINTHTHTRMHMLLTVINTGCQLGMTQKACLHAGCTTSWDRLTGSKHSKSLHSARCLGDWIN